MVSLAMKLSADFISYLVCRLLLEKMAISTVLNAI